MKKSPLFKSNFFITLSLFISINLTAQVPEFIEWENSFGGSLGDFANDIIQTSDGGFLVVGWTESSNAGSSANIGGKDIWVVKLTSSGNLSWDLKFGGTNDDFGHSVVETNDGGFVILAETESFDISGVTNAGGRDAYVFKISSVGNLVWQNTFGGVGNDNIGNGNIIALSNGGFAFCGNTISSGTDFWVVTLDASGNLDWGQVYGGNGTDIAHGITQTSTNELLVIGETNSTDNYFSNYHGNIDLAILKLSNTGSVVWSNAYGGSDDDFGRKIIEKSDGNYLFVGGSDGELEFGGDIPSGWGYNNTECWTAELDTNGNLTSNLAYEKLIGGNGMDYGIDLIETNNQDYLIVAYTTSDDGQVFAHQGNGDYWVFSLAENTTTFESLNWEMALGGTEQDFPSSIIQTNDNKFVVAGYSASSDEHVSFNNGANDFWVVKFEPTFSPIITITDFAYIDWGDYDNDGDLDLIGIDNPGTFFAAGGPTLYTNNGINFTQSTISFAGDYNGGRDVCWGDFDNDNDLDLAVSGNVSSAHQTIIYQNNGGNFLDIGVDINIMGSVDWGDMDNDGDLDLAISGRDVNFEIFVSLYQNDGGAFTEVPLSNNFGGFVLWIDYDNDGDLDLLNGGGYGPAVGATSDAAEIYINENGTFNTATSLFNINLYINSVDKGDYNEDGNTDILIGGYDSDFNPLLAVFQNNSGSFSQQIISTEKGGAAAFGDFDSDGDLDVLADAGEIFYYDFGTFKKYSGSGLPPIGYSEVSWVDFDNDNDLDLLFCGAVFHSWPLVCPGGECTSYAAIYQNTLNNFNFPPSAPTNLGQISDNDETLLFWDPTFDSQQNSESLNYNIHLWNNNTNETIISPMANTTTGQNQIAKMGMQQQNTLWYIYDLPENQEYCWQVQAIDHAFKSSTWSTTSCFTAGSCPVMVDLGSDQTACPGGFVLLDAGNIGATYEWNTGDNDQFLQVFQSGEYIVTVTDGCSASDTVNIVFIDENEPIVSCIGDISIDLEGANCTATLMSGDLLQMSSDDCCEFNELTFEIMRVNGVWQPSILLDANDLASSFQILLQATDCNGNQSQCWSNITVSDPNGCACTTSAGTMNSSNTPITICGNESATASHNNDQVSDGNDLLQFVLHDNPNASLGNIFSISNNPTFSLIGGMTTGTSYYISPISGNNDGTGNVDFNDLCFDISAGVEVIWGTSFSVDLGNNQTVCPNETVTLDTEITNATYNWNTGATSQSISVTQNGTYTVTVTQNGCSDSDAVQVNFEDTDPPTAFCNTDLILNLPNQANPSVNLSTAEIDMSFDNCGVGFVSFSENSMLSQLSFNCDDIGENNLVLWVTDLSNNQEFCNFTVTVQDNFGVCDIEPSTLTFSASSHSVSIGDNFCVDVSTENFIEIVSMQFSMNFNPDLLEFAGVQNLNLQDLTTGNFGGIAAGGDNGDLTISWFNQNLSGITVPNGTVIYQVCFNVIDFNCTTNSFNFSDSPTVIEINNGDGNDVPYQFNSGTISPAFPNFTTDLSATDATCNQANGTATLNAFGGSGDFSYQWDSGQQTSMITDLQSGGYTIFTTDNLTGCVSVGSISVFDAEDEEPPLSNCNPNLTIEIEAGGSITLNANDFDTGSTDNCDNEIEFSFEESSNQTTRNFDCNNLGINNLTIWLTDDSNNKSSCQVQVDIQDSNDFCNVAPCNFTCPPSIEIPLSTTSLESNLITIENLPTLCPDNNFEIEILDNQNQNIAGPAGTILNDCNFVGENLTITVTEIISGNTCSSALSITDDIPLTINCPADTLIEVGITITELAVENIEPVFSDNCPTTLNYELQGATNGNGNDFASGEIFDLGNTLVTYTATSNGDSDNCSFQVSLQNLPPLELNANCEMIPEGEMATVDITIGDFLNLNEVRFYFEFNPMVIQFLEFTNLNPLLNPDDVNYITVFAADGSIGFEWESLMGMTLPEDEILCSIKFLAVGNTGDESLIDFDTPLQAFHENGEFVGINSDNCTVTIGMPVPQPETLSLQINSINADFGNTFCFEITAQNFIDVTNANFSIFFDQQSLQYNSLQPSAAIPFIFPADDSLEVFITDPLGITVEDDEILFELCFDYIGQPCGNSTLIFNANENETSVFSNSIIYNNFEFQNGNVSLNDNLNTEFSTTNTNCALENGILEIQISGGSGNPDILWSNGETNLTILENLAAGNYSVTVQDGFCGDTLDFIIAPSINPLSIALGNDTTICLGASILLNAENDDCIGCQYSWSDEPNNNEPIREIMPIESLIITATVMDQCAASDEISITVLDNPENPIFVGPTEICEGDIQNYSIQNFDGNTNYAWQLPDNAIITNDNGDNISIDFSNTESGILSLIATNICGESDKIDLAIEIESLPSLPILENQNLTACQSESIIYCIENITNATNFVWNLPTGTMNTNQLCQTILWESNGDQSFSVTADNDCGTGETAIFQIVVFEKPTATLLSENLNVCQGSSFELIIEFTGTPPFNLEYSNGNQNFNLDNITENPLYISQIAEQSANYNLISVASNCVGEISGQVQISVESELTTNLAETICEGEIYNFNSEILTQSGIYKDTLTTIFGCDSIVTLNLTVIPLLEFLTENDIYSVLEKDNELTLEILQNDILPEGGWSIHIADSLTFAAEIEIIDNQVIDYQIIIEDFVGIDSFHYIICQNSCPDNCDTAVVLLNFDEPCFREAEENIPTGIHPNSDGQDDFFDPLAEFEELGCPLEESSVELIIVNRWGEIVFKSKPYPKGGWDGTNRNDGGKILPQGTYYYVLEIPFSDKTKTIKGTIHLLH